MNAMFGMNNNINNINNQINFMNNIDTTAQNLRNIIEPYENKIKQLEEIIRQKDFEIAVLKQKLNNNSNINANMINYNPMNNFMMNPMNNNMINNIMGNNFEPVKNGGKEIILQVKTEENQYKSIMCNLNDKGSILNEKLNISEGNVITFNNRTIFGFFTLLENGLHNGSLIEVKKNKLQNIIFQTSRNDRFSFIFSEDCPISIAIIHFLFTAGSVSDVCPMIKGLNSRIYFVYNNARININDETPISKYVNYNPNPYIRVFHSNELMGGTNTYQ